MVDEALAPAPESKMHASRALLDDFPPDKPNTTKRLLGVIDSLKYHLIQVKKSLTCRRYDATPHRDMGPQHSTSTMPRHSVGGPRPMMLTGEGSGPCAPPPRHFVSTIEPSRGAISKSMPYIIELGSGQMMTSGHVTSSSIPHIAQNMSYMGGTPYMNPML